MRFYIPNHGLPCYMTTLLALFLDSLAIFPAILATIYWLYILKVRVIDLKYRGNAKLFFKDLTRWTRKR